MRQFSRKTTEPRGALCYKIGTRQLRQVLATAYLNRNKGLKISAISTLITLHNIGGDEGTRTPDPLLAKQMLSQLSYIPGLLW